MDTNQISQWIKLDKIDDKIIAPIREVKINSESFKLLEAIINEDQQHFPIIIRRLTNDEFNNPQIKQGAEYGIIDGHHRFAVAQRNNKLEILATILDDAVADEPNARKMQDIKNALRMNSAIPMTTIQKGKIIYDLSNQTGKTTDVLGEELFGLAKSMAYRCVNDYKKYDNLKVIQKTRDKSFKPEMLNDIHEAWNNIPHDASNINVEDANQCLRQIESIKNLESKLRLLRNLLREQKSVREKLKNPQSDN